MYDIYMLNNTSKTIKDMFIIGVNNDNTKYEHTILTKLDNIIGYKFIMRNSIWIFNSNPKPYKNTMSFSAICQKNNSFISMTIDEFNDEMNNTEIRFEALS